MSSCTATGIVQLLCLEYPDDIRVSDFWRSARAIL